MSLEDAPRSVRVHIGIFGRTNSGKSSLLNALTRQDFAVVSNIAGTTTDPVYKSMEINGIGPVVFIDTAGFDDISELGKKRIQKTQEAIKKTDVALLIFTKEDFINKQDTTNQENSFSYAKYFIQNNKPFVAILNKCDTYTKEEINNFSEQIKELTKQLPVIVSAQDKTNLQNITEQIILKLPADFMERSYTGNLCKEGDIVLLVMPQDIQAPKGRLILPQVQILRELLDKKCLVMSCTTDKLNQTLLSLRNEPKLIITDSQVFDIVYKNKPEHSLLTSFSTLLAATKGDITSYLEGAKSINLLTPKSHVLIAEACTHAPLSEDIGREKIPRWLRKKYGEQLSIDIVSGCDFPDDLSKYDLIIHCGACMFNRSYVLNRQQRAKEAGVPMTNYGITIAYLNGILDKVSIPQ